MKSKPEKRLLITLVTLVVIAFALGYLYMFLGFAGEEFINRVIYQKPSQKTEISQLNSNENKLTSVAKYTVTFPSTYKVTQDKILSSNPFTILKNQSNGGEIVVNRSIPSGDGESLESVFKATNWILSNTEKLTINGNEATKGQDSQYGYLYAILVKKEITQDHPWLYWISTQNESLKSDLDEIAKSFEYTTN